MESDKPGTPPAHGKAFTRTFSGRLPGVQAEQLPADAQAALRQLSFERLLGYGVAYADAIELRGRVAQGEGWQFVATALAVECLAPVESTVAPGSSATKANRLHRASALMRMSQFMMLTDTDERRAIFARAADCYARSAAITNDRERVGIAAPDGALVGWWFPARERVRGAAVVVGGVEGWAMDFDALAIAFAARGVSTLMLDAPGQGESRMANRSYLTANWLASYKAAVDFVSLRCPGVRVGVVGNSMGGAFAMGLACADRRIAACCDNGGPKRGMLGPKEMTFGQKQAAMCGQVPWETASRIWASIDPAPRGAEIECPLLIVHGGMDPLISVDHPTTLLETAKSRDKTMVTFSDGDHCVYNHADDKHNLIGDWMADRLAAR